MFTKEEKEKRLKQLKTIRKKLCEARSATLTAELMQVYPCDETDLTDNLIVNSVDSMRLQLNNMIVHMAKLLSDLEG